MTEQPRSVEPPTPEETRWASFVMNEQRHKRPVSDADRTKAGEIMGRARRASGRTGGGGRKKASPLEVARAMKDVDAKVAEAQGINASREGEAVPAPTHGEVVATAVTLADQMKPAAEPLRAHDGPPLPEPDPDPLAQFLGAGKALLDKVEADYAVVEAEVNRLNVALDQARKTRDAVVTRRRKLLEALDAIREDA